MVFISRKIYFFTNAAYFLDSVWVDGRGHAHTVNRNCKDRIQWYPRMESNGAGRMALTGTVNASLELEEWWVVSAVCAYIFFFFYMAKNVKALALFKKKKKLKKVLEDFRTLTKKTNLHRKTFSFSKFTI